MGNQVIKNQIGRSLKKDAGVSENDITYGLQKTPEAIDAFVDSIYSDEISDSLKTSIKNKLKIMLISRGKKNVKAIKNIESVGTILGNSYSYFIFVYNTNEDNTLNIAYKLISGKLEFQKGVLQEFKGKKKISETVEAINEEETKKIIEEYLGIKEEENLYSYLQENKKLLSE
jgi:hypothetical protein